MPLQRPQRSRGPKPAEARAPKANPDTAAGFLKIGLPPGKPVRY